MQIAHAREHYDVVVIYDRVYNVFVFLWKCFNYRINFLSYRYLFPARAELCVREVRKSTLVLAMRIYEHSVVYAYVPTVQLHQKSSSNYIKINL